MLQLSKIQVFSHTFFNRGYIRKFSLTKIRACYADIFLHVNRKHKNGRIYTFSQPSIYIYIYILYIYIYILEKFLNKTKKTTEEVLLTTYIYIYIYIYIYKITLQCLVLNCKVILCKLI